jgi:hypothetical protein
MANKGNDNDFYKLKKMNQKEIFNQIAISIIDILPQGE